SEGDDRHVLRLAASTHAPIAIVEALLRAPGDVDHGWIDAGLSSHERFGSRRSQTSRPGSFDQYATHVRITGLRDRPTPYARSARMLSRHHADVAHQSRRSLETAEISELADERRGDDRADTAHRLQPAVETTVHSTQVRCQALDVDGELLDPFV